MLVFFAIAAVIILFIGVAVLIVCTTRKGPKGFYEVAHKRYGYRNEPHADSTTEQPNRLKDNEITDV